MSFHAHIQISLLTSETTISPWENLPTKSLDNNPSFERSYKYHTLKHGHGYTFVFERKSGTLIAAWGPALQMHPVDRSRYPAVFLNVAAVGSPIYISTEGHREDRVARFLSKSAAKNMQYMALNLTQRKRNCEKMWTVVVHADHDEAFRNKHGGSASKAESALDALLAQVSQMFENLVCVSIFSTAYTEQAIKNVPVLRQGCSLPDGVAICDMNAIDMMNFTYHKISGTDLSNYLHNKDLNIKILFTESTDDSPLFGTTFQSQVCGITRSIGWVKNANAAALAHEIGHMLGAQHATEGVMASDVHSTEELTLSPKSIAEIDQFISGDPRAWCLKPRPFIYDPDNLKHWRRGAYPVNMPMGNWSMTSTYSIEKDTTPTIILLRWDPEKHTYANNMQVFNLYYLPEFPCRQNTGTESCWRILFQFRSHRPIFEKNIAVGRIVDEQSIDLIVSTIEFRQGVPYAFYFFVLGLKLAEELPTRKTKRFQILPFRSENPQCSDIALGYINGGITPDIVHVHVDKRTLGTVFLYYIGFDVGPEGTVSGGWSSEIRIPNVHSHRTTSISVELADLDSNGMPELVISQTDDSEWGPVPYIRVGKDLNSSGHVTNGWTDYVQGLHFTSFSFQNTGAMTVHRFQNGQTGVVQLQQIDSVVEVGYRTSMFTATFLNSAKPQPEIFELDDGCRECYSDSSVLNCTSDVRRCAHTYEAVFSATSDHIINSNSRTQQRLKSFEKILPVPSPQNSFADRSLYCEGFRHRVSMRRSCETVNRRAITLTGVSVAFKNYFNEAGPTNTSLHSEVLYQEQSGSKQGEVKLSALLIHVSGNYMIYKNAMQQALEKLSYRSGMEQFKVSSYFMNGNVNGDLYIEFQFK